MKNHNSAMENASTMDEALKAGITMKVMQPISEAEAHNIMPIHINVRLKDGKKRFCHDCRFINKHVNKKKFKIETLNKEGRSIFAECKFGWLIDLSHAYYHIQVDRAYWKYLCFRWRGQVYCFTCLPFGLSSAPRIFTIVKHWREKFGIWVLPYIDDLTGASRSSALGAMHGKFMVTHLQNLGWIIQNKKVVGVPTPLREVESLGVRIDFPAQMYRPCEAKVQSVKILATLILKKRTVIAKELAKLAGLIMCLLICIGEAARIRTRSMYSDIHSRLKQGDDPENKETWKRHVHVSAATKAEL